MSGVLRLAWRYVSYHRGRTAILVAAVALIAVLPFAVTLLIGHYEKAMTARARATPMVVGAPGSRFELLLSALYFQGRAEGRLSLADAESIAASGLGTPLPLFVAHSARGFPVVGVTTEYFAYRHLVPERGHLPLILGDAVLGSAVADQLGLEPGGSLITDPTKLYDLSASYPLKLHVRGVLGATGSADDWAVFVDLKTAWVIEGIAHGHQDVDPAKNPELVLRSESGETRLNAAIVEYTEITPDNIDTFHVHATAAELPLTAVLVWPRDAKSGTILRARLLASERTQPLDPEDTLGELMGIVFRVKRFFDLNLGLVSVATVLFLILVVLLTLRIRQREIDTLLKIGCSRGTVIRIQALELGIVLAMGLILAAGLALAIYLWGTARPPTL